MRNPLLKEKFLEGNRQRWFAVLLFFAAIILLCDTKADLDAAAYLNFLTITGSVFILGASLDSVMKIKGNSPRKGEGSNDSEREIHHD